MMPNKILSLLICIIVFWTGVFNVNAQDPAIPIPLPLPTGPGMPTTTPTTMPTTTDRTALEQEANAERDDREVKQVEAKDLEEEELKIKFNKRQSDLPEAKIWGQQFFRNQSISLFTRSRDVKALDSYRLGGGDEIAVTIWGRTDYSANVIVDEDGFVELSNPIKGTHIPRVFVRGMAFSKVKKAIIERLGNHMNIANSQYSIELNYSRNITVNITGEVFNPGSYTIPSVNTAFNAMVASGGPGQIGSVRNIRVISSDKKPRVLDVYQFMTSPNIVDSFFLENNDYIYVPLAEKVVEITGAIERPYFYELKKGENLIELIAFSGGLKPDAYRRNIQIIRYANDEERLIDVNLAQLIELGQNFNLIDGDRIKINPIEQAYTNYVNVVGAVKLPGSYEIQPSTTIYDILNRAGVVRSAVMEKIYIKRLQEDLSVLYIPISLHGILDDPNSPDNLMLRPFDEVELKYKAEFIDKFSVSILGEVRKPGEFEYSKNMTLRDLIYMGSGISYRAKNSYMEISRLKVDKNGNKTYIVFKKLPITDSLKVKEAPSFKLEPFDQVIVRKSTDFKEMENVFIQGEVFWPGAYTMENKEERVYSLIERAGGLTSAAFYNGAKLIRRGDGDVLLDLEDLMEKGETSIFNYYLKPGDRIIIPIAKTLVSIAGRINHPKVKNNVEIAQMELDLELKKLETELEREAYLLENRKKDLLNPRKVSVPFHKGKRANFYIQKYGAGIDRKAGGRKRLVYVRYSNGMVKKARNYVFFKRYPKVEKGAMVYVDEKPKKIKKYNEQRKIDWYKLLTDTLAIVTSAFTVYALVRAVNN